AALNILRLHNTLRVLWRVAKTFGRVTYSQHSLYLTDNTNLLAAVIHSFGNWHDGCSVRLPHTLNLELLERFELLGVAEAQTVIGLAIRAAVGTDQPPQLKQKFKEKSRPAPFPRAL